MGNTRSLRSSTRVVCVNGKHPWILDVWDSIFQILPSGFIISGTWIPDSNLKRDSVILELNFGFQSPGFRIPQARISRIPDSNDQTFKNFLIPEENTQGSFVAKTKFGWSERRALLESFVLTRYAFSAINIV